MLEFLNVFLTEHWWAAAFVLSFSFYLTTRILMGGKKCPSKARLDNKVVVITGATGFIGREVAKELAERGANVILAVRNAHKGKKLLQYIRKENICLNVTARLLDLTNSASIRNFVNDLFTHHEHIDILINAAMTVNVPYIKAADGTESTITTNYFGPFLLTHLLLPLLSKSDNGRIINLTQEAHRRNYIDIGGLSRNNEEAYDVVDAYCESNLAVAMFTRHLAFQLRGTKMSINSVSPGLCYLTDIFIHGFIKTDNPIYRLFLWFWAFVMIMRSPKQGSQCLIYAAVEPALRFVSGQHLYDCDYDTPAESVFDYILCEELYKATCKVLNINGDDIILNAYNNDIQLKEHQVEQTGDGQQQEQPQPEQQQEEETQEEQQQPQEKQRPQSHLKQQPKQKQQQKQRSQSHLKKQEPKPQEPKPQEQKTQQQQKKQQ